MIARVVKWGNSLAVRIPSTLAKELCVEEGSSIEMSADDGVLSVRPVNDIPQFDLDELIDQITDDNRHPEFRSGFM